MKSWAAPQSTFPWRLALNVSGPVFLVAVALWSQAARADDAKAPPSTAEQRTTLRQLDSLLSKDIDNTRRLCALGQAPDWVAAKRAKYGKAQPFADAVDMCVATLRDIAGRQRLGVIYRELLTRLAGDASAYERWPRVIGAAVLGDASKVAIGNNRSAEVTPALAFDAGFTVAYQDGKAAKEQSADAKALKAVAEGCLGQHQDVGACFSVGYVFGAHAFTTATAASR